MWYQTYNQRIYQFDTPIVLPYLYRNDVLTVNAALDKNSAFPYGKRTYKYAGRLTPIFNRPGVGENRGRSQKLFLGNYQIKFDNPLNYEYYLEISIHLWTPQLDLEIWISDEESIFDVNSELGIVQLQLDRIENKLDTQSSM